MLEYMCIACRGVVVPKETGCVCSSCGKTYPCREGVADFLPDKELMRGLGLNPDDLDDSVLDYDAIHGQDLFNAPAEMAEAVALGAPAEGQRILDVGCGTGHLFDYLPRDAELTALDISPAALREVRRRHGQVQLVRGIGECLPFPDASFDFLFCMGSLEHFLSMEMGIAEFRRVLAPGGTAVILLPQKGFLFKNALYYYIYPHFHPIEFIKRIIIRLGRFKGLHVQDRDHHFTREEMIELFRNSGFVMQEPLCIPSDTLRALTFDFLFKLEKD